MLVAVAGACSGAQIVDATLSLNVSEASSSAAKRVERARGGAEEEARALSEAVLARRVEAANALTQTVLSAVLSVREAVPATRQARIDAFGEVHARIDLALEHIGARQGELLWSTPALDALLAESVAVLEAASELLAEVEREQYEAADHAYEQLMAQYEALRTATSEVARTAQRDPVAFWSGRLAPGEHEALTSVARRGEP